MYLRAHIDGDEIHERNTLPHLSRLLIESHGLDEQISNLCEEWFAVLPGQLYLTAVS